MTRIVAGSAGSARLQVPAAGTRPTSDRVREALFSALDAQDALSGSRVLDLYAGSGALGLEAASRGAESVTLVEKSAQAARIVRSNVKVVLSAIAAAGASAPTISVSASAVETFLAASSDTTEWDLVFLDPPYALKPSELRQALTLLAPRMATDGIVVVEGATRNGEPPWPPGLTPLRSRAYGDTTVWWAQAA